MWFVCRERDCLFPRDKIVTFSSIYSHTYIFYRSRRGGSVLLHRKKPRHLNCVERRANSTENALGAARTARRCLSKVTPLKSRERPAHTSEWVVVAALVRALRTLWPCSRERARVFLHPFGVGIIFFCSRNFKRRACERGRRRRPGREPATFPHYFTARRWWNY